MIALHLLVESFWLHGVERRKVAVQEHALSAKGDDPIFDAASLDSTLKTLDAEADVEEAKAEGEIPEKEPAENSTKNTVPTSEPSEPPPTADPEPFDLPF